MSLVSFLITLLILCIIGGIVWYILKMLPLPPQLRVVVEIIFLVVCVIILLSFLFGGVTLPSIRIG